MAVVSLKNLCSSLKFVDKTCCHGFLRAAVGKSCPRANVPRPVLKDGDVRNRNFTTSASSNQQSLNSRLDLNLMSRLSALEAKTQAFNGREFMNLSGLSHSPNLTPAGDSGATFYFDTHKLVTTLQGHGFSLDQAETITDCLTEILTTGASGMSKYMVSRNELAQLEIRMSATVEALRKDMVILEKSEFLMLKQENENMKAELTQLSRLLKDELLKLRSGLTLDMSLEKGRAREESGIHEQKIKDTNNRIETEIAKVRMEMEAQKLDLIKYLVGSFLSIVTVLIGWWRFVKG